MCAVLYTMLYQNMHALIGTHAVVDGSHCNTTALLLPVVYFGVELVIVQVWANRTATLKH